MNILIFEYKNFGIEDLKEILEKIGHKYTVISTDTYRDRISEEFDKTFEEAVSKENYDCVFTFNFSPVISNNCKKLNMPYIAFVYDSPQVLLYSYTIINPCNYVFIFDKQLYQELKDGGINTVYYMPLCANTDRLDRMLRKTSDNGFDRISDGTIANSATSINAESESSTKYGSSENSETNFSTGKSIYANKEKSFADIAFVGSLYNEKHNLFDRMVDKGLSEFSKGYLDSIMDAQMKVYGYFFMDKMLKGPVLEDMLKCMPVQPDPYGIETVEYLYSNYFLSRKLASKERIAILKRLAGELGTSAVFSKTTTNTANLHSATNNVCSNTQALSPLIKLYTPNQTPELTGIVNMGAIDYYNDMPYVFNNSRINLNISLRSIKSGIPLRGIDIMGAGGFLMSNYQEDFYDFFTPGEDCVLFESHDDLIDKCKYYLSHENERAQIAANGYGKVKEFHNYEVRLREIFEVVFN